MFPWGQGQRAGHLRHGLPPPGYRRVQPGCAPLPRAGVGRRRL